MTGEKDALLSLAETAAVHWWLLSQAADCSKLELLPLEMPGPRCTARLKVKGRI